MPAAPGHFRNMVKSDPNAEFPAEKDRYHFYVGASPYAERLLLMRKLKGLEDIITVDYADPNIGEEGWKFTEKYPDTVNGAERLVDLYKQTDPNYQDKATVPTLWDKKKKVVVSNETADMAQFLHTEFDHLVAADKKADLYPKELAKQIEETNMFIYTQVFGPLIAAGFAPDQQARDTNLQLFYQGMDKLEEMIGNSTGDYILGEKLTDVDVAFFPVMVRFDSIFADYFFKGDIPKNIRTGYPNIHKYLRNLYWNHPEFKDTTDFENGKKLMYKGKEVPATTMPYILPL